MSPTEIKRFFKTLCVIFQSLILALRNSRFKRAICAMDMFLGHSCSQAPVLVQLPNPSSSILATIDLARLAASTFPCGSRASWLTLAATKSMADPFLQVATQAPQPMHEAASMASSALYFGIGSVFPSGIPPVFTET